MKSLFSLFFILIIFSSTSGAQIDLLGQFRNSWDGEWNLEYQAMNVFYRLRTSTIASSPSLIEYIPSRPISLEQKYLHFRLRINSYQTWGGIEVRFSSDNSYTDYFAITLPYYSDPDFNILQPQQWTDYAISLGEANIIGNPNLSSIQRIAFYIQGRHVPEAEVFTVDFSEISVRTALHTGLVSFTFDDGYAEQYDAARIMARYAQRGTAYLMVNELNQPGYLTSQQVQELGDTYAWGISSHHAIPITDMTEDDYFVEMNTTFNVLRQLGRGSDMFHFAYPLGKQSRRRTLPWIQSHFLSARVAGGGAETLPPADWYMLKTFNVTPDLTAEDLLARARRARDNNEWLILMFHKFTTESSATDPLIYPIDEFEKFCHGLVSIGLTTHPIHEVYEAFHE